MPVYPNDMLSPVFLMGVVNSRPSTEAIKQQYKGLSLFPFKEVSERRLTWDIVFSENNLAGFYDPKGQAIPGDDILFSQAFASLIDVKASRHLDPDIANSIRVPGRPAMYRAGGDNYLATSREANERQHLQERISWCDDAVDSQIEYMAMQLASTGQIQWPPRDQNGSVISPAMPHWNAEMPLSIVFPMESWKKQTASSLVGWNGRVNATARVPWTNTTADVIQDLEIVAELFIRQTGLSVRGGRVIMSEQMLSRLAFNTVFINWVAGSNREQPGARQYIDIDEMKTIIKTRLGWTIETYDSQWTFRTHVAGTKPTVNRVPFMNPNKIIIIPPGSQTLGNMATTFLRRADGSYKSGKYAWSYETPKPPHEIEVGENIVVFPVVQTNYDWMILDAGEGNLI